MIWWFALAFALIGGGTVWKVQSLSHGYDADGNMWLAAPFLVGCALLVLAVILVLIGGGAWLWHHIGFTWRN